jgi:hypothetical protein
MIEYQQNCLVLQVDIGTCFLLQMAGNEKREIGAIISAKVDTSALCSGPNKSTTGFGFSPENSQDS